MDDITYVGIGCAQGYGLRGSRRGGRVGEVRQIGVFVDRWEILCKLAGRLGKSDRRLSFCDEAGLCGYDAPLPPGRGHSSIVVAPSLIPMKSGDRVKTISAMR